MSYLLFLAAAAAVQEERRRQRAAARRRREESEKSSKKSNSYSGGYSRRTIPYLDCVLYESKEDSILDGFFTELMKNAQEYREEQGAEKKEEADKVVELIEKYKDGRDSIKTQLQESGIQVEEMDYSPYLTNHFDLSEKKEQEEVPKYITTRASFNGIELTKETLEKPPFQDRYDSQKAKCDEYREQEKEIEKTLRRKELFQKFIPFRRYEREHIINQLKNNLSIIRSEYEKEARLKKELETFEAFSPEQLEEIRKYVEASKCISQAIDLIRSKEREFDKMLPSISDKAVIENAFDRTISKLGMSEEEIQDLYRRMDRVAIKRYRGDFDSRSTYYDYSHGGIRGTRKELVRGFIKHIYDEDPDFVDRNMEQVLEDEESRDKE